MKAKAISFTPKVLKAKLRVLEEYGQCQTRRPILPQPTPGNGTERWTFCVSSTDKRSVDRFTLAHVDPTGSLYTERGRETVLASLKSPFGLSGQRLWVRERARCSPLDAEPRIRPLCFCRCAVEVLRQNPRCALMAPPGCVLDPRTGLRASFVSEGGNMQQPGAPRTELTVITPAMATKWLATNEHNRSLSKATVAAYATDMLAGAWRMTHQGIGFDVDGKLIDGQHRLNAVIHADIPVAMMVTTGLPRNARDVIDAPRVRAVKDQLELIDGVSNANGKAAVTKIIYMLEHNVRGNHRLTLHQTRQLLSRDGERIERVFKLCWNTALKVAPFVGSIVFALGAGEKVFEFAEMVRNGEGLKRGEPAHTLRDYLFLNRLGSNTQDRLGTALCVLRSAHAHIHGEDLRVLRPASLMTGPLMEEILSFFRLANETVRGG